MVETDKSSIRETSGHDAAARAETEAERAVKSTVSEAKSLARSTASTVAEEATRLYEDGRDRARELASDTIASVKSEAEERLGGMRGQAADDAREFAQMLRDIAERSRSGSYQAQALGHLADVVANASDAVRDKTLGEMASDVASYARQRPGLFLGAAAIAGFALTRFAKASDPVGTVHGTDRATVYPRTRA